MDVCPRLPVRRTGALPREPMRKVLQAAILLSFLFPHAVLAQETGKSLGAQVSGVQAESISSSVGLDGVVEGGASGEQVEAPLSPDDLMFQDVANQLLPMTPEQIEVFRRMVEASHQAAVRPLVPDPVPISRSIDLSLKPGEVPPVIRMAGGNVATLTFSDATGRPWPVFSVTTGNPAAFTVGTAGVQGESNIIVISPTVEVATSNLVVTLVDHPVPIIVTVKAGEREIDYRVDMRINQRGPNASYDIVNAQSLPPTGDSVMLAFLDGVPPEGARRRETSRHDVEAWLYDDMLYVRTELDLLSPAYLAKSSNVSDLNVYTLMDAPVLILSKDGRMMNVSIR